MLLITTTKDILNIIVLIVGLSIFSFVILLKVQVMAEKVKAEVSYISSENDWYDFLYRKSLGKL